MLDGLLSLLAALVIVLLVIWLATLPVLYLLNALYDYP